MPTITLPEGKTFTFEHNPTPLEVATAIALDSAKTVVAARLDEQLIDATSPITRDATLHFVRDDSLAGLEVIRHSSAHLLAQAAKRLFPGLQVTIGPVIEDGFYYDFAYKDPFTPEDLRMIEEEMRSIVQEDHPVIREVWTREQAIAYFESKQETYKVEIIRAIPGDEPLSFYRQGEFIDLCRGPHVPRTGSIKSFKLTKVSGAFWRGDSKNPMLQRVYGTAWASEKDLENHLHRLEEAEKRDHRQWAKKLDLFHIQEEASGMVFWHPKGWSIFQIIQNYLRTQLRKHGYQEVNTPQLLQRGLWERSGHWDKFKSNMFSLAADDVDYALKPMNCPGHVQIFNQGLKSYKDLPLRLAEFGSCHRYEPSGALHGLMRVRNFVQDDAHIFCSEMDIQNEVAQFMALLFEVYADFGFNSVLIKLATRPLQRVGSDEQWDRAEAALTQALRSAGLDFEMNAGEGAFYGPKIEFSLKDCMGRIWQCGTIQVDFSMPERLQASYVNEHSARQTPVMLHRAILGSLERFIGILLEDNAGSLPVWLAPIQAVVMNITDEQVVYAEHVAQELSARGLRVDKDTRNEKIGYKIRERSMQRVPYLLVIGNREVQSEQVSIRTREGQDLGSMSVSGFCNLVQTACAQYSRKMGGPS